MQTLLEKAQNLYFYKGKLTSEGKKSVDKFLCVIKEISPRIILCANAGAAHIIKEYYEKIIKFDENSGIDYIYIDGKKTPILFSSMLTGQRALDKYSFQRLVWFIGKILKKN